MLLKMGLAIAGKLILSYKNIRQWEMLTTGCDLTLLLVLNDCLWMSKKCPIPVQIPSAGVLEL